MTVVSARMSAMTQHLLPKLAAMSHEDDLSRVIDLSSGENPLIQDELQMIFRDTVFKEKRNDFSLPTTFGGDLATRHALAAFFNHYFAPANSISPSQIVVTAGAANCVEALIQSICDEGDSVLIPAPYWFGFQPYITERSKVNIVTANPSSIVNHASELLPSLELALRSAPEPSRVKALLLCNPQNPLSKCYPINILKECLDFCRRNDMHFISDELYGLATLTTEVDDDSKFVSALSVCQEHGQQFEKGGVHIVWSASKLFGLSGLRIGCLISQENPDILTAVSLLTYAGVSSISATMLTTILASPKLPSLLTANSQRLSTSYSIFSEGFRRLGIEFIPATHGLFVFARLGRDNRSREDEIELVKKLKNYGILVSPGWVYNELSKEFGWVRVTFAVPEKVAKDAILRFGEYCI